MTLLSGDCPVGDRVLVCGGRDFYDWRYLSLVMDELHALHAIKLVIEGEQVGADKVAKWWAKRNGIEVLGIEAQWTARGIVAGRRRNVQMIAEGHPDVVVAFPGGPGTRNMLLIAKRCSIPRIDLRHVDYVI